MRFTYEDEGQKKDFQLREGEVRIGRDPSCDIVTANRSVSRKHILCVVKGTTIIAKDENSGNGMFVNDVRMPEAVLRNGDVLRAGKFALTFQAETAVDGTMVDSGGDNQDRTMVDPGMMAAAASPPKRAPSPSQVEAAGHKTAPLDDVKEELAKIAAAPPPPKKQKPASTPAEPAPPGKLKVVKGMPGSVRDLKGKVTLGTQDDNSLVLTGDGISRNHAEIVVQGGKWVVRDLASRNGTWVNGKKVEEQVLVDGDSIQIGSIQLSFASTTSSAGVPASAPATAPGAPAVAKPATSATAAAARKKKLLVISVTAVVVLVALVVALKFLPGEQQPDKTQPGQPDANAAFNQNAEDAWAAVKEAINNRQYQGAATAIADVANVYKGAGQSDAEVKAWKGVIATLVNAGPHCEGLNGQGWDDLKAQFEEAASKGDFLAEFAKKRAEWAGRCKGVWKEASDAADAESKGNLDEAAAHYGTIDPKHSCYGQVATEGLKRVNVLRRKKYTDDMNRFEASGDFESAVQTYTQAIKIFPEVKNDRTLFGRFSSWKDNIDASRAVKEAKKALDAGDNVAAFKALDGITSTDSKLSAEIERLKGLAQCGDTLAKANDLYKQGKTDEALAVIGKVDENSPLAPLRARIEKVADLSKQAQAAKDRKDWATLKQRCNDIVSTEDDKENSIRRWAEQEVGVDPPKIANELADRAATKLAANDFAGARQLAEEALQNVPGHEGALKVVKAVVKEATSRYSFLYAGKSQKPPEEGLKQAEEIKAMLKATDDYWKRVCDLIDEFKSKIDKKDK